MGGTLERQTAMPFYRDHIYPYLVDRLGNPPPIQKVRQQIISLARGKVLEIGVGSGANFICYNPARVSKLYALEPNPGMIRLAERQRHRAKLNVEFLDLPGKRVPLEDSTVDTVVSTFTLCTIPGIVEAIQGVRRVLPDFQSRRHTVGGALRSVITIATARHNVPPDTRIQWTASGQCHLSQREGISFDYEAGYQEYRA